MLYSEYLQSLEFRKWQRSPAGNYPRSKRASRLLAESLGLKVPREVPTAFPYVMKPNQGNGGTGVRVVTNRAAWVLEEFIPHTHAIRVFVFGGQTRMFQLIKPERHTDNVTTGARGLYTPEQEPLQWYKPEIVPGKFPWLDIPKDPLWVCDTSEMFQYAFKLAEMVQSVLGVPTRVDFFIQNAVLPTRDVLVYNELTVDPGIIVEKLTIPEADQVMGSWLDS